MGPSQTSVPLCMYYVQARQRKRSRMSRTVQERTFFARSELQGTLKLRSCDPPWSSDLAIECVPLELRSCSRMCALELRYCDELNLAMN